MKNSVWLKVLVLGLMSVGLSTQVQAEGPKGAKTGSPEVGEPAVVQEEYELLTRDKNMVTVGVKLSFMTHQNERYSKASIVKLVKDVLRSKVAYLVALQPSQAAKLTVPQGYEAIRRDLMTNLQKRLVDVLAQQPMADLQYSEPRVEVLSWRMQGEDIIRRKRVEHEAKDRIAKQQARCLKEKMGALARRSMEMERVDRRTIENREKEIYLERRLSLEEQRQAIHVLRRQLASARDSEIQKGGRAAQEACRANTTDQPSKPR